MATGNSSNIAALNHSKAARRHLRNVYVVEEQLRALLDSISYGTVSGESCAELNGALPHLEQVVVMLSAVERRESPRYARLAKRH